MERKNENGNKNANENEDGGENTFDVVTVHGNESGIGVPFPWRYHANARALDPNSHYRADGESHV